MSFKRSLSSRSETRRNQYLLEAAQEQVFRLAAESDETMTKNCRDIIVTHEAFFRSLAGIQTIIVIGHSLSPVDWDYFAKVASAVSGSKGVRWFFGCHGLRDLENLEALLGTLEIERSDVSVFQTDDIRVTPIENGNTAPAVKSRSSRKTHVKSSSNGQWVAKSAGCSLKILDQKNGKVDLRSDGVVYNQRCLYYARHRMCFCSYTGEGSGNFAVWL